MERKKERKQKDHRRIVDKPCHQRGGLNLPSIMNNDHMQFMNDKTRRMVSLPQDYRIIFDTGNESLTMIGIGIVDELGLTPQVGCYQEIKGVGGAATCYKYVELVCDLLKPYNVPGKDYDALPAQRFKVQCMVSLEPAMRNTLIFGHDGGLNQLFTLGYHIDAMYHQNHPLYLFQFVHHAYLKELRLLREFLVEFMEVLSLDEDLVQWPVLVDKFDYQPSLYITFIRVISYFIDSYELIMQAFKEDSESAMIANQIGTRVADVMKQLINEADFRRQIIENIPRNMISTFNLAIEKFQVVLMTHSPD